MFAKSKINRGSVSRIYKEFLKPHPAPPPAKKKKKHKNEPRMKWAIYRRGIPKD